MGRVLGMKNLIIRLQQVEIKNFKNVEYGIVQFQSYLDKKYFMPKAEILGLYGQNGSGKTTLVDAMQILQLVLQGESLPKNSEEYIFKGQNSANLSFVFSIERFAKHMLVYYSFTLGRDSDKVIITEESLGVSEFESEKKKSKKTIIKYEIANKGKIFSPIHCYNEIVKASEENSVNLAVAKKMAKLNATSFIFGSEGFDIFTNYFTSREYVMIIEGLMTFSRVHLFVINHRNSGLISTNFTLPFTFKIEEENSIKKGTIGVDLTQPEVVPKDVFEIISLIIPQMNLVLMSLIPGFKVEIKNYGAQLTDAGEEGIKIELMSTRNDIQIPLRCESEGIKKIVSILSSVIAMYNDSRVCIVIDELDAGIFEYLLGEILAVLESNGKGQLIFTSHNLRALEKLRADSILFTTTNPRNRYIHFMNVKNSNNLRSLYLRNLNLGGQKECLYDETNTYEIRRAFRLAGKVER